LQVLLRSCADWTAEERSVVKKILHAMGVTVTDRRAWLARLRQDLSQAAAAHLAQRLQRKRADARAGAGVGAGTRGRTTAAPRYAQSLSDDVNGAAAAANPGISPAAFLHCLRENNVLLTIEEEAALLDCLDIERLAEKGGATKPPRKVVKKSKTARDGEEEDDDGYAARQRNNTAIHHLPQDGDPANDPSARPAAEEGDDMPLIYYKSFLAFCARHCGDWTDSSPEVSTALHKAIRTINNPLAGLQELTSLLKSFDDEGDAPTTPPDNCHSLQPLPVHGSPRVQCAVWAACVHPLLILCVCGVCPQGRA
jgi:hypothetical protein